MMLWLSMESHSSELDFAVAMWPVIRYANLLPGPDRSSLEMRGLNLDTVQLCETLP
jgi:hypothetical protein